MRGVGRRLRQLRDRTQDVEFRMCLEVAANQVDDLETYVDELQAELDDCRIQRQVAAARAAAWKSRALEWKPAGTLAPELERDVQRELYQTPAPRR